MKYQNMESKGKLLQATKKKQSRKLNNFGSTATLKNKRKQKETIKIQK